MRRRAAALAVFLLTAAPAAFAIDACGFIRLTIVSFAHDGHSSVKGDTRAECFTYNMTPWYGEFDGRAWIVDETSGGNVVASKSAHFLHEYVWVAPPRRRHRPASAFGCI